MGVFAQRDSFCPPSSRSRGSQNNRAKILPGLNPNLLKQVESLPLRAHRERERRFRQHDTYLLLSKCTLIRTYVYFPTWMEISDLRPAAQTERKPGWSFRCRSYRRGGFLRSPWRTTEWVSRGETGLHWGERRIHSRCLRSDNEGGAAPHLLCGTATRDNTTI